MTKILKRVSKIFDAYLQPKNLKKNIFRFLWVAVASVVSQSLFAIGGTQYVSSQGGQGRFPLVTAGKAAPLYIGSKDYPGVKRALNDLKLDIGRVTNIQPEVGEGGKIPSSKDVVIVGTLGKNAVIDKLVKEKKIDVSGIAGKWEAFLIQVIEKPFKGVDKALVIVGSDKRGTIYGIYDLSERIGVSPWYWWADVTPEHKDALYVLPGKYSQSPSVKYRGIFLNDEYPDLTRWITEKFGTIKPSQNPPIPAGVANYNSQFYTKLFELILRLKGNYLWPAMWNNAFNEDDPENPRLADEYGIVMGTSHQEPMLRAQKEWDRRYLKTIGAWNYAKYPAVLDSFWREGIKRNKNYESIITIGLRGANDSEMAPGGPKANMAMLEKIVEDQRKMIAEEINPDITKVPQMWCLYKEVLDYYNEGMRVPDDVTLLWAEDNWGNVRRLPTPEERKRSGGAGIYYHFDYHGGPRNYQWINTDPIAKIWDQMSLSKQYGADKIWIVNVGHFKGYEFPMEYFMNLAWNTEEWTNNNINEYTELWAKREFGDKYAKDIAEIIEKYTKYNGRRKPELLSPSTYSLVNYQEAETVVSDYNEITQKAEQIYNKLPNEKRDAFYELVLFSTKASALVNELYLAAGENALYAKQNRASTNDMADKTRELFKTDTSLMGYFNRVFAHGKWDHFMDQTHLGYTGWWDPPKNSLNAIKLKEISVSDTAKMGVAIDGSEEVWPDNPDAATLPKFDVFTQKRHYIDIFNKGKSPFEFSISSNEPWIVISEEKGTIEKDKRVWVSIDWNKIAKGSSVGIIRITGTNKVTDVTVDAFNPTVVTKETLQGFVEGEGFVSMEAEHFTRKSDAGDRKWIRVEDYGHTLSAMRATAAANAPSAVPGKDAPCLEYKMFLFSAGKIDITAVFGATLNFMPHRPIQYAISVDDQEPVTVTLVPKDYNVTNGNRDWEKSVSDNYRLSQSFFHVSKPGYHTLKVWMVDPGVLLQKVIVDLGGVKPSYLGPPESFYRPLGNN
jgi:hypothetical protein